MMELAFTKVGGMVVLRDVCEEFRSITRCLTTWAVC